MTGKNVFVAGASKGIGRAIAISYAKAGAAAIGIGARSSLESVTQEMKQAAQTAGRTIPHIFPVKLDVLDRESVEAAASQVAEAFGGKVDILINNAGYLDKFGLLADSDPESWWYTYTVNVRGTYLMTRSFLPLMLRQGDKQIVNVASRAALVTRGGGSAYQTSKLALLRLTELIDSEYGDKGVVAMAVHPGGVATAMAENLPEDMRHSKIIVL